MYNEQQRNEASSTLLELIHCGIKRGVYSSVEVAAIHQATHVIQTPPLEELKQPVDDTGGEEK